LIRDDRSRGNRSISATCTPITRSSAARAARSVRPSVAGDITSTIAAAIALAVSISIRQSDPAKVSLGQIDSASEHL
jgi:hypothetical protein